MSVDLNLNEGFLISFIWFMCSSIRALFL